MKKFIKYGAIVFGLVFTVIVAAIVFIVLTFDPNDYKDEISSLVKSQTGRTLTIQDDLSLSFFPWIGVESGVVIFGNAEGFGPEPFARIDAANINVKLLPLFKKQIEIGTVKLNGLSVSLVTNPQGITNWDDLIAKKVPSSPSPSTEPPAQTPDKTNQALPLLAGLSVGGLDIRDAQLKMHDQRTNTGFLLDKVNLKSGPVSLNKPFNIELSSDMKNEQPAVSGTLNLVAQLTIDLEQQRLQATGTRLQTHLAGELIPGGKADIELKADIAADIPQQSLDITALSLSGMGISMSGELHGKNIIDDPLFQGALKIAEFNPRTLMQQLAFAAPTTSDPKVLTKAAVDLEFSASTNHADVKQLSVRLDDTALNGNAAIKNFTSPAIRFSLNIDDINLDRYLPPSTGTPAATPATAATAGAIELPLETLRTLNIDGSARIGKLKVSNLSISEVAVTASAHNGLIKLHPVSARLYGGTYKGHIELDATGNESAFSFDEQLSDLQVEPFLHDLIDTDFISGTANAAIMINTRGKSFDDLRKTLNGKMTFSASEGRIDGHNLLGSIKSDYGRFAKTLVDDAEKLNQTVFSRFAGTVTIKNGLASTQDLLLVSSQLDVNGKGTADLVTEILDLKLEIIAKKELAKLLKILKGRSIPYYIKGTFTAPEFKSGLSDVLKDIGQEALDKEKAKLEAKLKAREDELRRKAAEEEAKLKQDLDARQKQEEEKLKKEIENKLDEKLKDLLKF